MMASQNAELSIAYRLPFEVLYSEPHFMSRLQTVRIVLRCSAVLENPAALLLPLRTFVRLAATGALAGAQWPPAQSRASIIEDSVSQAGSHLTLAMVWEAVDVRSSVVLVHLLIAKQMPLRVSLLEMLLSDSEPTQLIPICQAEEATFPGHFASLPFELVDESPESGAYTFTAICEEPISPLNKMTLTTQLSAWLTAVLEGAYGVAPIAPEESYAEPSSAPPEVIGRTAEWTIFKLRADPACIKALVNIVAAFHERCQKLEKLTIS